MKEIKGIREEARGYSRLGASCGVCFIAGGIYVLDQIEEVLDRCDFKAFPLKSRQDIDKVIKQLKGKRV